MLRRRIRAFVLLASVVGGLTVPAACGSASPEQQILNNFFRAARLRDNTTLANIASVGFNPRTDGTVEQFEVVDVGAESRRTVDLASLIAEEAAVRAEEDAFSRRRVEFQTANQDAIQRVARAENARQPVRGADVAVQESLTKWRQEQAQHSRRLSDVRERLNRERSQAVNSLTPPGQPDVDITGMNVEIVTKPVTVNAQVRTPEGQTVPRTLQFTFQRVVGTKDGQAREGRWQITGLQ